MSRSNAVIAPSEPDQRADLRDADFAAGEIRDGDLWEAVRVSDATLSELSVTRLRVEESILRGVDLSGGHVPNLTLADVRLAKCNLANCDARGGWMTRVAARECRAKVTNCELRGCGLDAIRGVTSLRGARMPWDDIVGYAGLFAGALGISVLDEGDGRS